MPTIRLPLATVLEYGSQIADAVAFAHAGGIVHRHLKSSNIVITKEGRPKVLDFGLAQRVPIESTHADQESIATMTAARLGVEGTPQYMSPEALRGESSNPRSDVWSLGSLVPDSRGPAADGKVRPSAHGRSNRA